MLFALIALIIVAVIVGLSLCPHYWLGRGRSWVQMIGYLFWRWRLCSVQAVACCSVLGAACTLNAIVQNPT